jgi:hypothetical protein
MYDNRVQIAFFSARKFQRILLQDKLGIHFVEHHSSEGWVIDNEKIPLCPSLNSWVLNHYENVLQRLIESGPIFSRHYDDLPSMELALRSTTLSILAISEKMSLARIDKCVLGTAASHHLDTLMLETACQIAGIEQIFEYYVPENRVLPLRQKKSIEDRSPLGGHISDFSFSETVKTWAEFGYSAATHSVSSKTSRAFYGSCLLITLNHLRNSLWLLRSKRYKPSGELHERLRKRGLVRDLLILRRQKNALQTLSNYVEIDRKSNTLKSVETRPHFLIMAHFQPEATSFPEGGSWHNFVDIVVELKKSFPEYLIVYKEHPACSFYTFSSRNSNVGISRSSNYYTLLRQLGCIFIGDDHKDIENPFSVVVTITGSVTLERSLKGLPTVVMGEPWYKGIPGMIRLADLGKSIFPIEYSSSIHSGTIDFLNDLLTYHTFDNQLLNSTENLLSDYGSVFLDEYYSFFEFLSKLPPQ